MLNSALWFLLQPSGAAPAGPTRLRASVIAGPNVVLTWTDSPAADEVEYSVERRDLTAAGMFAEIDTVAPGVEEYEDVGPFTEDHVYQYRLTVVGGQLDGQHSNTAKAFATLVHLFGSGLRIGIGLGI